MRKTRRDLPGEIQTLLSLVHAGRLFEVQAWVREGRCLRPPDNDQEKFCPLFQAVERGFHSMVDVLFAGKDWDQDDLDRAIARAMENQRVDLADLLLERGASATAVDFCDVCRTMDLDLMERYLRMGCDPALENAFARALDKFKARPLLRFLRDHLDELPGFRAQASLALGIAVREERPRWVALLAWAGADPYMKVPEKLWHDWNFENYRGMSPAKLACWSRDPKIFKLLKLEPNPEQARDLLGWAVCLPCMHAVQELLRMLPKSELNSGDPPSCSAVETIVRNEVRIFGFSSCVETEERQMAEC
jgi:hypothetical protein